MPDTCENFPPPFHLPTFLSCTLVVSFLLFIPRDPFPQHLTTPDSERPKKKTLYAGGRGRGGDFEWVNLAKWLAERETEGERDYLCIGRNRGFEYLIPPFLGPFSCPARASISRMSFQ